VSFASCLLADCNIWRADFVWVPDVALVIVACQASALPQLSLIIDVLPHHTMVVVVMGDVCAFQHQGEGACKLFI
jgi:hypothetical protein